MSAKTLIDYVDVIQEDFPNLLRGMEEMLNKKMHLMTVIDHMNTLCGVPFEGRPDHYPVSEDIPRAYSVFAKQIFQISHNPSILAKMMESELKAPMNSLCNLFTRFRTEREQQKREIIAEPLTTASTPEEEERRLILELNIPQLVHVLIRKYLRFMVCVLCHNRDMWTAHKNAMQVPPDPVICWPNLSGVNPPVLASQSISRSFTSPGLAAVPSQGSPRGEVGVSWEVEGSVSQSQNHMSGSLSATNTITLSVTVTSNIANNVHANTSHHHNNDKEAGTHPARSVVTPPPSTTTAASASPTPPPQAPGPGSAPVGVSVSVGRQHAARPRPLRPVISFSAPFAGSGSSGGGGSGSSTDNVVLPQKADDCCVELVRQTTLDCKSRVELLTLTMRRNLGHLMAFCEFLIALNSGDDVTDSAYSFATLEQDLQALTRISNAMDECLISWSEEQGLESPIHPHKNTVFPLTDTNVFDKDDAMLPKFAGISMLSSLSALLDYRYHQGLHGMKDSTAGLPQSPPLSYCSAVDFPPSTTDPSDETERTSPYGVVTIGGRSFFDQFIHQSTPTSRRPDANLSNTGTFHTPGLSRTETPSNSDHPPHKGKATGLGVGTSGPSSRRSHRRSSGGTPGGIDGAHQSSIMFVPVEDPSLTPASGELLLHQSKGSSRKTHHGSHSTSLANSHHHYHHHTAAAANSNVNNSNNNNNGSHRSGSPANMAGSGEERAIIFLHQLVVHLEHVAHRLADEFATCFKKGVVGCESYRKYLVSDGEEEEEEEKKYEIQNLSTDNNARKSSSSSSSSTSTSSSNHYYANHSTTSSILSAYPPPFPHPNKGITTRRVSASMPKVEVEGPPIEVPSDKVKTTENTNAGHFQYTGSSEGKELVELKDSRPFTKKAVPGEHEHTSDAPLPPPPTSSSSSSLPMRNIASAGAENSEIAPGFPRLHTATPQRSSLLHQDHDNNNGGELENRNHCTSSAILSGEAVHGVGGRSDRGWRNPILLCANGNVFKKIKLKQSNNRPIYALPRIKT